MIRRPPSSTRTDTLFPYTTLFRSIAALGIKLRNGCAYHGLALNVDMDLAPFLGINPCGYEGLKTVDLRSCGINATVTDVGELLAARLNDAFNAHLDKQAAVAQ